MIRWKYAPMWLNQIAEHRHTRFRAPILSLCLTVFVSVSQTLSPSPCYGETQKEAADAWKLVMENMSGTRLSFKYLPAEHYGSLIELGKQLEANGRVTGKEFLSRNAAIIDRLVKAASKTVWQKMVKGGVVDEKSPACFVFVPLPCPSDSFYQAVTKFIEAACEKAEKEHLKILLVSTPYGVEEFEHDYWKDTAAGLSTKYAKFIQSGTLKITTSFPGGSRETPGGYLFRGGELVREGNIGLWSKDVDSILNDFKNLSP